MQLLFFHSFSSFDLSDLDFCLFLVDRKLICLIFLGRRPCNEWRQDRCRIATNLVCLGWRLGRWIWEERGAFIYRKYKEHLVSKWHLGKRCFTPRHSIHILGQYTIAYQISTHSFRGNYSFLSLEIVENSNSCYKFQFFT